MFEEFKQIDIRDGIKKTIRKEGTKVKPIEGQTVKIRVTGSLEDGSIFCKNKLVSFTLGNNEVVKGLEIGVSTMSVGEISTIYVPPKYAFGKRKTFSSKIPNNAALQYEVELIECKFEETKKQEEIPINERINRALNSKEDGNIEYSSKNFEGAIEYYNKALELLNTDEELSEDQEKKVNEIKISSLSNIAQCYLSLKNYNQTIEYCNKVLKLDENNIKGYYRRGQAKWKQGDYEEAKSDFEKILSISSDEKIIKNVQKDLIKLKKEMDEYNKNLKKKFKGLFS